MLRNADQYSWGDEVQRWVLPYLYRCNHSPFLNLSIKSIGVILYSLCVCWEISSHTETQNRSKTITYNHTTMATLCHRTFRMNSQFTLWYPASARSLSQQLTQLVRALCHISPLFKFGLLNLWWKERINSPKYLHPCTVACMCHTNIYNQACTQ